MSNTAPQRYRIVFDGEIGRGHERMHVKRRLAALFRTDAAIVDQLFTGRPVVLKQGIDAEEAIHFISALNEAGAVSRMEPVPPGAPRTNRVSFLERRLQQRRKKADRRKRMRSDAYVPDRRHDKGRRETELD